MLCILEVSLCSLSGLGLTQDVAGATFMAAGSSAPELVTAFLGDQSLVKENKLQPAMLMLLALA